MAIKSEPLGSRSEIPINNLVNTSGCKKLTTGGKSHLINAILTPFDVENLIPWVDIPNTNKSIYKGTYHDC
jgi:hypothetical protein